jgi:transcriptional regulator with XRE-family HTH domain
MRALLATEFAALLVRADVTQAAFARLTGVTSRQVNNWCRGRAAVPTWAGLLAALLQDHSPEALTIAVEEAQRDLLTARPPTESRPPALPLSGSARSTLTETPMGRC